MNNLNFQDIEKDIFFNALPNFSIDRLTSFSKGWPGRSVSWNTQFIDNLSWIKGRHTFKFGVDIRRLRAQTNLGFTNGGNYGDYVFRGTFSGRADVRKHTSLLRTAADLGKPLSRLKSTKHIS